MQVYRNFLSLMSKDVIYFIALRWSSPSQAWEPVQGLVGLDLPLGRLWELGALLWNTPLATTCRSA